MARNITVDIEHVKPTYRLVRKYFLGPNEAEVSHSDYEKFKSRIKFVYEPHTDRWFPVFLSALTEAVYMANTCHPTLYQFFYTLNQNIDITPFGNYIIERIGTVDDPEGVIYLDISFRGS